MFSCSVAVPLHTGRVTAGAGWLPRVAFTERRSQRSRPADRRGTRGPLGIARIPVVGGRCSWPATATCASLRRPLHACPLCLSACDVAVTPFHARTVTAEPAGRHGTAPAEANGRFSRGREPPAHAGRGRASRLNDIWLTRVAGGRWHLASSPPQADPAEGFLWQG